MPKKLDDGPIQRQHSLPPDPPAYVCDDIDEEEAARALEIQQRSEPEEE